ncbi:MAG: 3-deoxy-7-phosphoheptulonate synthase [Phycisphaerales bacterium]|nr:3-deoxy-7-phosphoheptulonate synthase [Phycisphaerales bacterium]
MSTRHIDDWRSLPVAHQPPWPDEAALAEATGELAKLPPLVTSWEIETLKSQLAQAARGERFLLQGGDCAESFAECTSDVIANKLKILLQMSLVLVHGTHRPVIRVGRFAGQYAKPRSSSTESRDDQTLPSFYGDNVNRPQFEEAARRPDPWRLLRGYERSAMTLNFIRALVGGGFADLHHPEYWDLGFVQHADRREEYAGLIERISSSLSFMETLSGHNAADLSRVDFFTSHEGLLLNYEAALTRAVPRRQGHWLLSTHFPWIGMRTAQVDEAHVAFFSQIQNPIAVKVGPDMPIADLNTWIKKLLAALHPDDEPGRLTLIHRFGAAKTAEYLPALIEAVQKTQKTVLFVCDPMHGNTRTTADGLKTRRFEDILLELEQTIEVHAALGSVFGGIHIELTGDNVTECTGGARGLRDQDLHEGYRTMVDPRLNAEQALELAMLVARRS